MQIYLALFIISGYKVFQVELTIARQLETKRGISMLKKMNYNVLFVSAVVAGLWIFANPFFGNQTVYRQVHATGECLRKVPKDRVSVVIEVRNLADDMRVANEKTSATYRKLSDAIARLDGVELETKEVSGQEKTEWNKKLERRVSLGFESVMSLEVVAKDQETIGKALALAAGYKDAFSRRFNFFTSNELMKAEQEACMSEAARNAREKALALASGGKARLGKMVNASYVQRDDFVPVSRHSFARKAVELAEEDAAFAPAPTMYARDGDMSITVNATFELK